MTPDPQELWEGTQDQLEDLLDLDVDWVALEAKHGSSHVRMLRGVLAGIERTAMERRAPRAHPADP